MGIRRSSAKPHNSDDDVKRRAYHIRSISATSKRKVVRKQFEVLNILVIVFTSTVTIRNVLRSSLFPFEDEFSSALADILSKNIKPSVVFQEPI